MKEEDEAEKWSDSFFLSVFGKSKKVLSIAHGFLALSSPYIMTDISKGIFYIIWLKTYNRFSAKIIFLFTDFCF